MCSQYWNLIAEVECPECHTKEEIELQTHWMGEVGSYVNRYHLGEKVQELRGIKEAVLDGTTNDLVGDCPNEECEAWLNVGARIKDEAVTEIWILNCTPMKRL